MTGTVLCVGALSLDTIFRLDSLPAGPGKFLPTEAVEVAQGMATAQAATIVRLGGRARLWASCGDDANGDRIIAQITEAGIDLSALRRVPGARSGFSSIFMDRHGERMIVPHYDPALRTPPSSLPDLDGIALTSVDVRWPDAALLALGAAHDRGLPTLVDIDTGPEDVLLKLFHNADMAIASADGARVLTGESDPLAAVKAMGRQHPGLVAVTTGEDGAFWRAPMGDRIDHVRPRRVEAIDTLAAGDVFHGAFALRIAEGAEYFEAFEFAATAAALKCTRFGGRLGAPTRAEVDALLA
jgi:sulfofructose kinase